MKNDTLQQLLAKYQQGKISEGELERLNILTHKDEVLGAATNRAHTIIRRRTVRNVSLVCAALTLVGAGVWLLRPAEKSPLIAELNPVESTAIEEVAVREDVVVPLQKPASKKVSLPDEEWIVAQNTAINKAETQEIDIAEPLNRDEPTVVCNNQCDADSVINDIWKFLTA